ncbi:hypothetical protein ElyMa_002565400 [Elysia marginata]|uniref:Uncharacterized protein n=1 Tax=Elysia marginata TaxID=1093978 RepID=A0AAV4GYE6_9GAST|nr:hypothetical protein ElyMa_002565400 [Elysia marginata]
MAHQGAVQTFWGVVKAVDWEEKEAVITDHNGVDIEEVLLGLEAVSIKPKIGSNCLIGIIDNKVEQCFLIWAEELEELGIKSERLKVDSQVDISFESQNLGDLFRRLCDELKKVIVVQGTSPNIPAIEKIVADSKKVLI